jgi:hypothetical protein
MLLTKPLCCLLSLYADASDGKIIATSTAQDSDNKVNIIDAETRKKVSCGLIGRLGFRVSGLGAETRKKLWCGFIVVLNDYKFQIRGTKLLKNFRWRQ